MSYNNSREIELFIKDALNLKPGTKSYYDLEGMYYSIVSNENESHRVLKPAEIKKQVDKLHKYLDKVMTKLVKKKPELGHQVESIRSRVPFMTGSSGILEVYEWLKQVY